MDAADFTFTSRPLMEHFEAGDPHCATKHVERSHVALVDDVYAAIGNGDEETLLALLAPDATLTIEGFLDMEGRWEGAANVLAAVRQNFSRVEGQQVGIEQVCAQGDQLVVLFRETGRRRPTGEQYDAHVVVWYRFAGAMISSICEIAVTQVRGERGPV